MPSSARPRTNRDRNNVRHIPIFFVFLVANIGGLLTPLGDPRRCSATSAASRSSGRSSTSG
jgi:Na+/H+ antiporter NhaD/arsenite permease-like protein